MFALFVRKQTLKTKNKLKVFHVKIFFFLQYLARLYEVQKSFCSHLVYAFPSWFPSHFVCILEIHILHSTYQNFRKHSCFDQVHPVWSAFILWHQTLGSMPRVGLEVTIYYIFKMYFCVKIVSHQKTSILEA